MTMEKGDRRKSPEPTLRTTVVTPKTLVLPTVSLPLYSQSLLLIALLGPDLPNQEEAKPRHGETIRPCPSPS